MKLQDGEMDTYAVEASARPVFPLLAGCFLSACGVCLSSFKLHQFPASVHNHYHRPTLYRKKI